MWLDAMSGEKMYLRAIAIWAYLLVLALFFSASALLLSQLS